LNLISLKKDVMERPTYSTMLEHAFLSPLNSSVTATEPNHGWSDVSSFVSLILEQ